MSVGGRMCVGRVRLCVHMCVYACIQVRMYACLCVFMSLFFVSVFVCACMRLYVKVCLHVCVCARVFACKRVSECAFECMHAYMYVRWCMYS